MKKKTERIVIAVLSVLLVICLALLFLVFWQRYTTKKPVHTEVSGNQIGEDSDVSSDETTMPTDTDETSRAPTTTTTTASRLSLHRTKTVHNAPFFVKNMFPGDFEINHYCVRVSHNGPVTVEFIPKIRDGYEVLAEVLKCRISLQNSGKVLYDGLIADLTDPAKHTLNSDKQTVAELLYEITVYLDESVGNRYQNKELVADFEWRVTDTESLGPPETGQNLRLILNAAVISVLVFALTTLLIWRKRNEKQECS
jgi:hypothetical protein